MTKEQKPLVTIGIPTYNRADGYLKNALESALQQTYPNIEIIVSDNCSPDNTEKLINSYKDERIKYFKHKKNIGANNNFNFCVEKANGMYFHMLHDDDLIDPDFIETCIGKVDSKPDAGLIRTGMRIIDGNGFLIAKRFNKISGQSFTDFIFEWFDDKTSPYLCNTLFKTEALREVGGFHSKTHLWNDVVAEMKIAAKYPRIEIEEIKASFRDHGDNRGSASRLKEWVEDSKFLLDVLCDLVPKKSNELIYLEGSKHFARLNYLKVKSLNEPSIKKLLTYWYIYKAFDFKHSPLGYILPTFLKPYYWKNKVKKLITSPG
ncbi:glycosyltransferase family 2 protein [Fodinibius saliphilus]|uniref:glycosyltransferase family 2 protein n=1 Tax=Fodinibius saliphilus TaxID=1920650 RepID=UPI0011093F88|nr:glycosyltransferase family 2 protein [Fodinibius saliphilus]